MEKKYYTVGDCLHRRTDKSEIEKWGNCNYYFYDRIISCDKICENFIPTEVYFDRVVICPIGLGKEKE